MSWKDRPADLNRLLAKCKAGDRDAWDELVERFRAHVYSIPKRAGLREDDCADIFQTTFAALIKSIDTVASGHAIPSWLAVTASRETFRLKRINSRTQHVDESVSLSLDELVATEEASALDEAVIASDAFHLRDAVAKLADKCRDLLTAMYFEDDVSYTEVSERFSMPIGAIGPTRARCLNKLKSILAESGFFESDVSN